MILRTCKSNIPGLCAGVAGQEVSRTATAIAVLVLLIVLQCLLAVVRMALGSFRINPGASSCPDDLPGHEVLNTKLNEELTVFSEHFSCLQVGWAYRGVFQELYSALLSLFWRKGPPRW